MFKTSHALVLSALSFAAASHAATLSTVPMQGGMVMPMLSWSAADQRLHIELDPTIPLLTPLLVSHPADGFNPADPWFDALDPGREGQSFSRRYGFVMAAATDPLPAGTQIWLRKLEGDDGLSAYRYSSGEPRRCEPIFGTAGSTNAMAWNDMMFHPLFAATPGTNALAATFDVFLVDTVNGTEVPNSGTGPFRLEWDNQSDGRPELALAQRIVVFWPTGTTNYVLEGAADVAEGTWSAVTNAPVEVDGRAAIVLDPAEPRRFFRMKRVP